MLIEIHPKLPMRDKSITRKYYIDGLGFSEWGEEDYEGYLMIKKDKIQIHFFEFKELDPKENYGQVYIRVKEIETYYKGLMEKNIRIHTAGQLQVKIWGQKEFALLDPDHNLLTFGESV